MSKKTKIVIGVVIFCLVISGGYYGRLILQSKSSGVAIKDLDKYKYHVEKEKKFYENF